MKIECERMKYKDDQRNEVLSASTPSRSAQKVDESKLFEFISSTYLEIVKPSGKEEDNKFQEFMATLKVGMQRAFLGSLIVPLQCDSLQILEGLWSAYCSGVLSEMVQSCLVTEYILKELNLSEVKLKTTISEEDYNACKQQFMQSSGMFEVLFAGHFLRLPLV